jgi:hypothetical protein
VVFGIYFVVPYFEVFEEHNKAFEEHNKALIEMVDRIDSVDFDNYYQFVVEGRNESVLDYLSRLYQLATNRNISDDILLAVAMNGLKPELKTIVMTKEPKNVEELRHCATLAEKAIS